MAAKPAPDATEPVADPPSGGAGSPAPLDYDAFLSYTQRDRPAVSGIQKGLHRIGRRLGQLRALRVFRDDTDLTASPDLWSRIVDALDRSRFFIVTLSPLAAQSQWVNQEITYWLQHRGREQLMLVLVDGQLQWDQRTARFDPAISNAARIGRLTPRPPALSPPPAQQRAHCITIVRASMPASFAFPAPPASIRRLMSDAIISRRARYEKPSAK